MVFHPAKRRKRSLWKVEAQLKLEDRRKIQERRRQLHTNTRPEERAQRTEADARLRSGDGPARLGSSEDPIRMDGWMDGWTLES